MAGFPSRKQAEEIWEQGIRYRLSRPYPYLLEKEYRFHTLGVAAAVDAVPEEGAVVIATGPLTSDRLAEKIAALIPGMDGEKAYVLGLLHDYGKRIGEREENKFHGQEGYEQMMFLGYPDVAQICLTHTFPDKNFDRGQYSFPDEWIEWAREKLAGTVYTDYDYLIAFCDKLFEACEMVSIEKRIEAIVERYGLNADQRDLLYRESIGLKKYFDEKTGDDVYRILEIED